MSRLRSWRYGMVLVSLVAGLGLISTLLAPYIYVEVLPWLEPHQIVMKRKIVLSRGRMVDNYWTVERLNAVTFAIGEPNYYQINYSYLILGNRETLLFDAGSGNRNILSVVRKLTNLPVTVLPSHLHYDHIGGISRFSSIALIDLPATRADVKDGKFTPGRYEFAGSIDGLPPPRFRVTRWLRPSQWIDLGGRRLQVLATPGHTPTSVALYDPEYRQFFAGDFIYPGPLYAQLPGASRSAYQRTATSLLETLPASTTLWTAHGAPDATGVRAPSLQLNDLRDLNTALNEYDNKIITSEGFYPQTFRVNSRMIFLTGFRWNNK